MERFFNLRTLVVVTLLVHVGISLAVFLGIQPIRAGDEQFYHRSAIAISEKLGAGAFSFDGDDIQFNSWYNALLGIWYWIGAPHPLWDGVLSALLAAASALLLFALVRELGGSGRQAFWIGILGANAYPSYLYFGSFTLRDTTIVPLALAGFLITLKFLRRPSVPVAALFFANAVLLFGMKGEIAMAFLMALLAAAAFLALLAIAPLGLRKEEL